MKNFTDYVNQTIPSIVNKLEGEPSTTLQKVEPEGARPWYGAKDQPFQNPLDYILSFMLKEKMLKNADDMLKYFSTIRLVEDLRLIKSIKSKIK